MKDKLIHKELTYVIRGILFEVHNELGRMLNEKQYSDLIEEKFRISGISYSREEVLEPNFPGERRGRSRTDFIVDGKVVVEVKAISFLTKQDYFQCQRYLSSTDLELALLVNFHTKFLTVKRILNHELFNKNNKQI